jgi:hypothetical protein
MMRVDFTLFRPYLRTEKKSLEIKPTPAKETLGEILRNS